MNSLTEEETGMQQMGDKRRTEKGKSEQHVRQTLEMGVRWDMRTWGASGS